MTFSFGVNIFFTLMLLSATESKAISLMGIISDKYLSDCKDGRINSVQYNQSISDSLKCNSRVTQFSVYTDVIRKSEDQLFSVLAEEQRGLIQCHKKNIDTLNRDLKTDTHKQNIFLEKTRYNLVQLQELAYKRARLENSLKTQRGQDRLFRQPVNNQNRRLSDNNQNRRLSEEDFTKSLIAKLDDEITLLKTSFPHYNAIGLQKIINDSIKSATLLGQRHSSLHPQVDRHAFLEDVGLEAQLFNHFHKNTLNDIPNINKLLQVYSDHANSFQESDNKLAQNMTLINGERHYKLSNNLKRELFSGPSGEKFISNQMQNASPESKDMICKLDARYGKELDRNTAIVDGVVGVGLLAITAIEAMTPLAPAAPVTAAVAMTRLASVGNVIKNANLVKKVGVGLSSAALVSSVESVAKNCQRSLSQVSSCTAEDSQAQIGKLNLGECVISSAAALGGAGMLGVSFIRNTKAGRSVAEKFGNFRFHEKLLAQRRNELGVLPEPQVSMDVRTVGLEAAMANAGLHGAHWNSRIAAGTEILKYGQNNPKILEAAKSFWKDGSVLKLNALDANTRLKTVEFMHQFTRMNTAHTSSQIAKATDPTKIANLQSQLRKSQQMEQASENLKTQVYAETMATTLTASAKRTLDVVSTIDTSIKTGTALNSIRKYQQNENKR